MNYNISKRYVNTFLHDIEIMSDIIIIMAMRRNTSIDIAKMIFAVLVIAIHSDLFSDVNDTLYLNFTKGIAVIAVPFFFVTSGYFFYDRICKGKKLMPYLMKILIVFLAFTVLDGIVVFLLNSDEVLSNVPDFLHMLLLSGPRLKYWYMTSLLLALIVVIPFWRRKNIIPLLVLGIVMYIVMMTVDSYYVLTRPMLPDSFVECAFGYCNIFHGPQAGISSSLMFVSLGAFINKYKPGFNILMLVGALILFFVELNVVQHRMFWGGRMYLSLIIVAPLIFMFCLAHPGREFDTSFYSDWCLYTYMTHHFVVFALMDIGITGSLNFLLTCIIVLPLTYLISRQISRRKRVTA